MYTSGSAASSVSPEILVVRFGAMGDVIHTLPSAASLKQSFRGSRLTWLIDHKWACLLEGNPFVDQVITLDRSHLSGILETRRRLRQRRYAMAVDFQGLCKSAIAASLTRVDHIYGFHQSQAREPAAALLYSQRVRTGSAHIVDRNLELAAAAGASNIVHSFPIPEGCAEGELPKGGFVLASPLAGWPGKQWPLEYYLALARRLRRELDLSLVLNVPPSTEGVASRAPGVFVHVSGIPGLIGATRQAAAVVGIDSGPAHLAAALGKPGVAIYGPTDPARNGPYGDSFTVLRSPRAETSYKRHQEIDPSMREISPDAVLEALKDRLSRAADNCGSLA
jgi:heptosyltransferase-1